MIRSLWKSLLWYLFAAWRWLAMVWKNSVAGTATAAITNAPTQTANALIVDEARRPRTERLIPASFIQGKKPRSLAAIDRDLQATTSRKEQLISEKATKKEPLLAVEKEVAEQLDSTYDPLIREAEQRIYELRRERELALIDYCYTRVDIAFLKVAAWSAKHDCGLPKYAIFTPDTPFFKVEGYCFNSKQDRSISLSHTMDWTLSRMFDWTGLEQLAVKRITSIAEGWRTDIAMAAMFNGKLTDASRSILRNQPKIFDQVFLVTKAPEWNVTFWPHAVPQPTADGPVALIGRTGENYWLIDKAENAAAA